MQLLSNDDACFETGIKQNEKKKKTGERLKEVKRQKKETLIWRPPPGTEKLKHLSHVHTNECLHKLTRVLLAGRLPSGTSLLIGKNKMAKCLLSCTKYLRIK